MKKDYSKAYSEVYEVLKHIPEKDRKKIPNTFVEFLEENMEGIEPFVYNEALPLEKQNISNEGKLILAILYRDYWASDEEKRSIIEKEIEDAKNEEILKSQKYKYEDLFKKSENQIIQKNEENDINKQVIKYHENIIMRFLRKIRKIFLNK